MANRFNTFMDAWMDHRVWGLPLRMIFLCSWHRVHIAIITVGLACIGAGVMFDVAWLRVAGKWVAAPSVVSLLLLPVLAILFIGLEKLAERPSR